MDNAILGLVEEINSLTSVTTESDVSRLQELAERFFKSPEAEHHLEVWFRVYERFPNDDAWDVFWSILHELESQPACEVLVVESINRRPSRFPVLMVNRMLNGGITEVDGAPLIDLLSRVTSNLDCEPIVRQDAQEFLDYQSGNG